MNTATDTARGFEESTVGQCFHSDDFFRKALAKKEEANQTTIQNKENKMKTYKTCESVRVSHTDKLCDFIADFILDSCLEIDPDSRVACEVMATGGKIIVAGEITCELRPYIESDVKKALQICGYSPDDFRVFVNCHRQSKDIASGGRIRLKNGTGARTDIPHLGQAIREQYTVTPPTKPRKCFLCRLCLHTTFAGKSIFKSVSVAFVV